MADELWFVKVWREVLQGWWWCGRGVSTSQTGPPVSMFKWHSVALCARQRRANGLGICWALATRDNAVEDSVIPPAASGHRSRTFIQPESFCKNSD